MIERLAIYVYGSALGCHLLRFGRLLMPRNLWFLAFIVIVLVTN